MAAQNSIRLPGSLVRRFHFGGMVGFQAGGAVNRRLGLQAQPPSPLTPGAPGGLVGGIQQSLAGYNQQFAAPLQNIAGQVAGFNPFAGELGQTAQGTLSGLLSTGLPTDVSGLTDVASQRAQRQFQDFLGGARERFGALNLGSSSYLEEAKAREAARLAQGVAEQGIISGVGAQEAATGRRAGAFNPFLEANQQALQARLGAGGLYGTAANVGFNPIQGALGLSGQLVPPQERQMNLPPVGGGAPIAGVPGLGGFPSPGGVRGRAGPLLGVSNVGTTPTIGPRTVGGGKYFARGGQVAPRVDYGDYLSNLLFGQQFTRRAPESFDLSALAAGRGGARPTLVIPQAQARPGAALPPTGGARAQSPLLRYIRSFVDIAAQTPRNAEDFFQKQNRLAGLSTAIGALTGAGTGRTEIGPADSLSAALRAQGQNIYRANVGAQQFGGQGAFGNPFLAALQSSQAGNFQTPVDVAKKGEEGGMIQGPSQPPDTVPILAQGGEVILPLETVRKLHASKSKDPLIREIKRIAKRHPEEQAQAGGSLQPELLRGLGTNVDFSDFIPGLSISGGDVPTYSLVGTPEEPGALEDRELQDAIRGARARYNRLYSLALRSPREAPIHELVGRAQQELESAQQDLLKSRQQVIAKEQAAAQKEVAAAQKAAADATRIEAESATKARMDETKSFDTAIQNILVGTAKAGGDPLGSLEVYFQAKGIPLPPGLAQAIQARQQAQQQPPAPVTSGVAGTPLTAQAVEQLKAQQEAENRFLAGVSPGRRALIAALPGGALLTPEGGAQQTPPMEVAGELEQVDALLQTFEQGGVPPEQLEQYKEYLAYLASRNLAGLSPEQRQRIVAINRMLQ